MGKITHQSVDSDMRRYQNVKTDLEDVKTSLTDIATPLGYRDLSETNDDGRLMRAIQKAGSSDNKIITLGGKTLYLTQTIDPTANITIINGSIDSTADWSFSYQAPNGTLEIDGVRFWKVNFTVNNGVKLNNPTNGFTEEGLTQSYIMRSSFYQCSFTAKTNNVGIGVQWSKLFDGHIVECKFGGFDIDIDFHGCDLCSIRHNRITGGVTSQIRLTSYGSFGSQTLIQHNDMLNPSSGCFILSSDRSVRIKDNYIECIPGRTLDRVIKILTNTIEAIIKDNRVEVQVSAAPYWLEVQPNLYNLVIENNTTAGNEMGDIYLPNGYKWYTGIKRAKVTHKGNTNSKGLPFNSIDNPVFDGKTAFIGSPHLDGLAYADYGVNVKVKEESFTLPALSSYGSMLTFLSNTYGNVNIGIVAKSTVDQQRINYQRLDGTTVVDSLSTLVGTNFKYYPMWSNVAVSDLQLKLWNDDTVKNGDVLIKKVIVEWV